MVLHRTFGIRPGAWLLAMLLCLLACAPTTSCHAVTAAGKVLPAAGSAAGSSAPVSAPTAIAMADPLSARISAPVSASISAPTAAARWTLLLDTVFQHLGTDQGLPHADVTALAQDGEGFLWFGTQDGLARWDGYRFRVYQPDPNNSTGLPDNYIQTLHVDDEKRLWVGTTSGGLARFDAVHEQFVRIAPDRLGNMHVNALANDGHGGLWLGTEAGLTRLSEAMLEGRADAVAAEPGAPHVAVNALLRDTDGRVWVGTDHGLLWRANEGNGFQQLVLPVAGKASLAVTSLFQASDGQIWIGSREHGVFQLRPGPGPVQVRALVLAAAEANLSADTIAAIREGNPGQIWIATAGQGLVVLDAEGARRLRHDVGFTGSLADDFVWCILRDRAGLVWVGSQGGVSLHDPRPRPVDQLFSGGSRAGAIADTDVTSVHVAQDGRIWLGLLKRGVQIINPAATHIDSLRPDPARPASSLPPARVFAITTTAQGMALIGTERGLYQSDGHAVRLLGTPGGAIRALQIQGSKLWLGGDNGIWLADLPVTQSGQPADAGATQEMTPAASLVQARALLPGVRPVSLLQQGKNGELWIGTRYQGLFRYHAASGKLRHFAPDPGNLHALSHGFISSVLEDDAGRLWVGTQGGGVHVCVNPGDPRGLRFARIGLEQGLPSQLVNKLLQDRQGQVWVSTDGGLARLDATRLRAEPLTRAQGGALRVYWLNSGATTSHGELLFGAAGGLSVVRPPPRAMSGAPSPAVPPAGAAAPVVITHVQVGGKELLPGRFNQAEPPVLQIEPAANRLAVEFSLLNYATPELNRFAFRLEGYDPDWIATDPSRRRASYTNLPPGDYRLHLRAAHEFGQNERILPLRVLPAWHQTWWSRLLALSAAVAAMLALVQGRTRYLRQRQHELEAVVAQRTQQLRDNRQELLLANHELSHANEGLADSMTQLQQAQLQLVQQEKLASLGTLMAGIAHEINNPSNFAQVGAYVLSHDLAELHEFLLHLAGDDATPEFRQALQQRFDKLAQSLASVKEGTTRIRDLVRDLRTFARTDEAEWKRTTLAESLQATVNLVRTQYASQLEIRTDLAANPEIACAPAQLNQVFMTLIVNACQAIAARAPEQRAADPGLLLIVSRLEGNELVLEFSDNGGGIEGAIIEKIFDPFFTTKTVGDGMGMGLAISHGIIEKHRGSIQVQSTPGKGTRFQIRLPLAPEAGVPTGAPEPAQGAANPAGAARGAAYPSRSS